MLDHDTLLTSAARTLRLESKAVADVAADLDASFAEACKLILATEGRVIVTGMGKSGHIAGKIAATLASTGTPAFFVHPGEASHGDMGMITVRDTVLALSNSGTTPELLTLLPLLKRLGVRLVSMTGRRDSTLAEASDVHIHVGVAEEACPLDLAPTSSTTAALAMGDALAIALLESRGFTEEDFAFSHPGGALGKRLLLRVEDLMGEPMAQALDRLGRTDTDSLFIDIALGNLLPQIIASQLAGATAGPVDPKRNEAVAIRGTEGFVVTYAKCCCAIPGDPIGGYLSPEKGLVVHRDECRNLLEMREHPERMMNLRWDDDAEGLYSVGLRLESENRRGIIAVVATRLNAVGMNIDRISTTDKDAQYTHVDIELQVSSRTHLARIVRRLRSVEGVRRVIRIGRR